MPVLDATDYYGLCQEGVMTLLRSLPSFSGLPQQVTDNVNDINKGAACWAVFIPSTFGNTKLDAHNKVYTWVMLFNLYVRYKTAAEAPTQFRTVRSSIINLLDVYPTLNGVRGVEEVSLAARSEVLQDTPGENPNFVIQTIAVSVKQRIVRKF